jgi:hypothetical protein
MPELRAVEQGDEPRPGSVQEDEVLAELADFLRERVIGRLPVSSEWSWTWRRVLRELESVSSQA